MPAGLISGVLLLITSALPRQQHNDKGEKDTVSKDTTLHPREVTTLTTFKWARAPQGVYFFMIF